MSDLINRTVLLKTYKNWLPQLKREKDEGDRRGVETCIAVLEDAPTVDAVPVRRGKWECGKPCSFCGEDRFKGLDADIWSDWEPPFCPNCGADMREEQYG